MSGITLSEWIMVGIIFAIVVAAPRVGKVGEMIVSALGGKKLARTRMAEQPLVYIADPTAEAARVASALQARGYTVLDVPLALLVSRVAVQTPALVMLDVDASDALDTVTRLREGPAGESVEVLLVGEPGRTLAGMSDAVLAGASGFLPRPVDPGMALRKVQSLVPVDAMSSEGPLSPRRAPASIPPSSRPHVAPSLSLHEPSLEPGAWALGSGNLTSTPRLSDDLQRILSRAEARVASTDRHSSVPPSPEEEIEAVLPLRMLESLDEPLLHADDRGSWASSTPAQTEGRTAGVPAPSPSGAIAMSEVAPGAPSWAPPSHSLDPAELAAASLDPAVPLPPPIPPDSVPAGRAPDVSTRVERMAPSRSSSDVPPSLPRPDPAPDSDAPRVAAVPDAVATIPPPRRTAVAQPPSFPPDPVLPADLVAMAMPPSAPPTVAPPHIAQRLAALPPAAPPDLASLAPLPRAAPLPAVSLPTVTLADRSEPTAPPTPSVTLADRMPAPTPVPAVVLPAMAPPALPAMAPPAMGSVTAPPAMVSGHPESPAPARPELPAPVVLEEGTALRLLAKAAAERWSGVLCFEGDGGLRRVVVRDGDLVTAGSSLDEEALVLFLEQRGELPREVSRRMVGKLPPFGRHAGAALVANGHLAQDRLWQVLRAHAEWLTGKAMVLAAGVCSYEEEPAGRLRSEPAVFGGSTGSEVLVEVARRVIPPEEALTRLGGRKARLGDGRRSSLLAECALRTREVELVERSRGFTVGELLDAASGPDFSSVLLTLVALGVLETLAPSEAEPAAPAPRDELDDEALRARVRARMALVEEGDYFAVLAVPRSATPYEIKRAFLELRRSFEPSRVLSPATADLAEGLRLILEVLDEAYEVLRDPTRRERYRRAIEARPPEE